MYLFRPGAKDQKYFALLFEVLCSWLFLFVVCCFSGLCLAVFSPRSVTCPLSQAVGGLWAHTRPFGLIWPDGAALPLRLEANYLERQWLLAVSVNKPKHIHTGVLAGAVGEKIENRPSPCASFPSGTATRRWSPQRPPLRPRQLLQPRTFARQHATQHLSRHPQHTTGFPTDFVHE